MSILIKGMAMPKGCNDCNFQCFAKWGGDSSYANEIATKCLATDKFVFPSDSERDENCPLIELPPHGRLIDADAAMKAACEALCHLGVFCPDNLCKEVRETFDAVPTIIESEKEDG